MNKITIQFLKSPYGELIIGSFKEKLCLCDWRYRKMRKTIDSRICQGLKAEYKEGPSDIIETAKSQLNEYFTQERQSFDIPLLLVGTDFQKSVWIELLKISFGTTESYMGLSKRLGDRSAIRAIAAANGANAISIIVPCHRILGSKGELTGYAGGIDVKRKLLELEGIKDHPEQYELFE